MFEVGVGEVHLPVDAVDTPFPGLTERWGP